jgi:hypothetical protein
MEMARIYFSGDLHDGVTWGFSHSFPFVFPYLKSSKEEDAVVVVHVRLL